MAGTIDLQVLPLTLGTLRALTIRQQRFASCSRIRFFFKTQELGAYGFFALCTHWSVAWNRNVLEHHFNQVLKVEWFCQPVDCP
jgi:hypothetical protein